MDGMLLSLEQAGFAYRRGRPVLRGVTVSIAQGKVTAVVGPNGAGKSTFLRVLLGVLSPSEGRALIDCEGRGTTQDVGSVSARRRAAHVAYVAQQSAAGEAFTVEQIVRLGRLSRPGNDDAVMVAMEQMSLMELRRELFATLSAGQQQRVALARAIAQLAGGEPAAGRQAILADEPCSAMDPKHMLRSMDVLREQAAAGRGVVVVLHDLTMALRYADEAIVLDAAGTMAAKGAAEEVLSPEVLGRVYGVEFERLGGAGIGAEGVGVAMVPRSVGGP